MEMVKIDGGDKWELYRKGELKAGWVGYVLVNKRNVSKQRYHLAWFHAGAYSGWARSCETEQLQWRSKKMFNYLTDNFKAGKYNV